MKNRVYMIISGCIFGIVAVLHLVRVVNGWALEIGPWSTPMWISCIGIVVPAVLCVSAVRLVTRPS